MREAIASARAQPVVSAITAVVIAGMCAAVLLTSGRTVGAEQQVIRSIDTAGTRSLVVRAEPGAGLTAGVLDRIGAIEGIEWSAAFGAAEDAQNTAFDGGTRVALREAWAADWTALGLPEPLPGDGDVAYASPLALAQLGLEDPVGGIALRDGNEYAIGGKIAPPDYLGFLEPVLIAPRSVDDVDAPISALIVISERPDLVAPITEAVKSVLAAEDPSKVQVQNSESLATLRALIEGQLGTFGRSLTLGILALTALLVAVLLFGMVTMRRKDFGRRRALGASQPLIIALITTQTAIVATGAAAAGSVIAVLVLLLANDPIPSLTYIVGVSVLAVLVAVVAALIPAAIAAQREPIRELRVP
ncbi:FtsX-like permease family protein [Agromyces sp. GXQ0307]|uniref:FtsX-like permease family protein n=1 Tax=Agromyces sp. GXQ0307 TaxID=3377835 RepID=UPI00383B7426